MRSAGMRHPEDEQLLRYADGELPAREAGQIRSHLQACWQCRIELEELHKVVGECVRYRHDVLQTQLPPPPAPWGDIYPRFAEIDASLNRPSLLERAAQALQFPVRHARRWAPVAAALLLIWVLFHQLRDTPSVQAAALLRRAVAAAEARPRAPRRLEIRTRNSRVTRLLGPGRQLAAAAPSGVPAAEALASLEALFRAAHYSWEDPLSASSYQAWRNQLPDKQDEVATVSAPQSPERTCYRIRTTTASGELAAATLQLSVADLRPIQGRLEFRNQEWVEMAEVAEEAPPASEVAAAGAARTEPTVASRREQVEKPPSSPTLGDELRVLAVLHQVGADLGDPVEVSRSGGQILVAGVGVPPQRQRQIQEALGPRPNVVVRFADPAAAAFRPDQPGSSGAAVSAEVRDIQARMEKQLGGRLHFEQLAAQLLDLSETMMSRAYALRRLAERFPRQLDAELSGEDRQILRNLLREHAAVLAQDAAQIERLLSPALPSLGGSISGASAGAMASDSWQPAMEELFRAARRAEALLAVVLGAAPGGAASGELPSQLLSSLAQLRASAEACQRLIAQGFGGNQR